LYFVVDGKLADMAVVVAAGVVIGNCDGSFEAMD